MLVGKRVLDFVKLGRPKFLLGGVAFYGLGAALAGIDHAPLRFRAFVWGQAIVTSTQLMTHYSNDYFDLAADRANTTPTRWSGGSRVLPSGALSPRVALVAASVFAVVSLGLASWFASNDGSPPLLLPFWLLVMSLAWSYSSPPLRLLGRGLGELATVLVVTVFTPLLGFYLQCGAVERSLFLVCLPLCALQFSMLLTIELPDRAGDAASGKRTLVVRWGERSGARAGAALIAVAFVSLPLLVWGGLPWNIAATSALVAPLGVWQAMRLWRGTSGRSARFESLAAGSVGLLFLMAVAELSGTLISWRDR
jgi:1,4-dihydroxy-2-naphthoate octaprenyltransferase